MINPSMKSQMKMKRKMKTKMNMNTQINKNEAPIKLNMRQPSRARDHFHIGGAFEHKENGADIDVPGPEP